MDRKHGSGKRIGKPDGDDGLGGFIAQIDYVLNWVFDWMADWSDFLRRGGAVRLRADLTSSPMNLGSGRQDVIRLF